MLHARHSVAGGCDARPITFEPQAPNPATSTIVSSADTIVIVVRDPRAALDTTAARLTAHLKRTDGP